MNARGWEGQTPLHEVARTNDNPEVIAALLKAGADVNVRAGGGRTPLHTAAKEANPAVVAVLLEAGADVDARTRDGNTPLHEAAFRNPDPAVLELLVKAGADLQARRRVGPHSTACGSRAFSEVLGALPARCRPQRARRRWQDPVRQGAAGNVDDQSGGLHRYSTRAELPWTHPLAIPRSRMTGWHRVGVRGLCQLHLSSGQSWFTQPP